MAIRQFIVDAFTSVLFSGNPAAVCPLKGWLDDSILQAIASENNLSETAFFVPMDQGFTLRWFTPLREVDLCGHATLASAHVLFNHLNFMESEIRFYTRSGELAVRRNGLLIEMVFPMSPPAPCEAPEALLRGLGGNIVAVLSAEDYLVVYPDEEAVRALTPDFKVLKLLGLRGVIVTAPGNGCDFVSRFFAPKLGVDEDPVTGSAHCQLAPYWASRLHKKSLNALQVSKRSGQIFCQVMVDRVLLSGQAVTFMMGDISLEAEPYFSKR